MPRLILVRHGEASAGWGDDADPDLSHLGREQARAMAEVLAAAGPRGVVTSPLRRTRETAAPLETQWGVSARVEPLVGEIASPGHTSLEARTAWLHELMRGTWSDASEQVRAWRSEVLCALTAIDEDAVVVTHFVAINVAVGAAQGDDRTLLFRPGNCSRTVLDVEGDRLRLVELGDQGVTVVR